MQMNKTVIDFWLWPFSWFVAPSTIDKKKTVENLAPDVTQFIKLQCNTACVTLNNK